MRYRISRFGIHSTALIVAILYFILALVLTPIFFLAARGNAGGGRLPPILLVLIPVIYAVVGYVFTAIGCWLYNIVAPQVGGIVFTLEQDQSGIESP